MNFESGLTIKKTRLVSQVYLYQRFYYTKYYFTSRAFVIKNIIFERCALVSSFVETAVVNG
jgi:hypothetical protein